MLKADRDRCMKAIDYIFDNFEFNTFMIEDYISTLEDRIKDLEETVESLQDQLR